jgi:hypothetical protein
MATPLSKNESNKWSSDDSHLCIVLVLTRKWHKSKMVSSLRKTPYRPRTHGSIGKSRTIVHLTNDSHVNQECRSLSSWKYRNYAKETMAIASKHQATMRMIHPATNLEMDTTEAPQQQQQ